jgi:hypothetical protein
MHTSMLTAVVVCVLAHGKERCAQEAREKGSGLLLPLTASNNANDDTTFTSNSLLSSSSCFSFFFCFFPFTQGEGKEEREKRKQEKKRAPNNGPSCACSEHAPNEHNENSEKGKRAVAVSHTPFVLHRWWTVLEAIAHSPYYHTRGRSCCTAHNGVAPRRCRSA